MDNCICEQFKPLSILYGAKAKGILLHYAELKASPCPQHAIAYIDRRIAEQFKEYLADENG